MREASLSLMLNAEGDFDGRDAVVKNIPGQLDFAFVGTWGDEQGKGFDLEFVPELRHALGEKHEGRAGDLTRRKDVPKDGRGRYDLLQLMTATRWSAAFAQGTFTTDAHGVQALRLTSSDPLEHLPSPGAAASTGPLRCSAPWASTSGAVPAAARATSAPSSPTWPPQR